MNNSEREAMYVYVATTFIGTSMICNYNIDTGTFNEYLGQFMKEYNFSVDYGLMIKVVDILMDDYFGDLLPNQQQYKNSAQLQELFVSNVSNNDYRVGVEVTGGGNGNDDDNIKELKRVLNTRNDPMIIKKLREIALKKYNVKTYPPKLKGFIEFLNNKQVNMVFVKQLFSQLEKDVENAIKDLTMVPNSNEIKMDANITSLTQIIDDYSVKDYMGYSMTFQDTGNFRKKLILATFRKKTQLIKFKNLGMISGENLRKIITRANTIYGHFIHIDEDVVKALVETRSGYVENLLILLYGSSEIDYSVQSKQAFLHAFRYLEGKNDFGKIKQVISDSVVGQVVVDVAGKEIERISKGIEDKNEYRKYLAKQLFKVFENPFLNFKDFNVLRNLLLLLDLNVVLDKFSDEKSLSANEKPLFKSTCVQLARIIDKLNSNTLVNKPRKGYTTKIKRFIPNQRQRNCFAYLKEVNKFLTNELYSRFIYVQTPRIDTRELHRATLEEFNGFEDRYALYTNIVFDSFKTYFVVDIYVQALINFTDVLLEYDNDNRHKIEWKIISYLNKGKGYREKLVNVIEPIIGDGDNLAIQYMREEGEGGDEWEEDMSIVYNRIKNLFRIWLHLFIQVFGIRVDKDKVIKMFGKNVDDPEMDLQGVVDEINQANEENIEEVLEWEDSDEEREDRWERERKEKEREREMDRTEWVSGSDREREESEGDFKSKGGGYLKNKGGKGGAGVKKYLDELYLCNDKKKRKAYRVVGQGNRLFVVYKGEHTRVGDVKGKQSK